MLNASSVLVALSEEELVSRLVVSREDGHAPQGVHLESALVAVAGNPVEVITGLQEGSTVLLDLIVLLLLLQHLLKVLEVSHLSRGCVDTLVVEFLDPAGVFLLAHATI